jgi:hypothetical protein
MKLILYARPEVWNNRHTHDNDEKETSWFSIGDALNNTLTEVQRKTHNASKSICFYGPELYCIHKH